MPKGPQYHQDSDPAIGRGYNYDGDSQWAKKPLTPAQLLCYDIRLETLQTDRGPMLEICERPSSSIVPDSAAHVPSESFVRIADTKASPIEKQTFANLEEKYGWMRHLRVRRYDSSPHDRQHDTKCRWVHCSSKFPEYLRGFLWSLSGDLATVAESMRMLDTVIQRQTRFSKHGKYFAPFSQILKPEAGRTNGDVYPMMIAVPFLDWTVQGGTPPLRFQVDPRENFLSSRSSAHILRSILQYYYRLEDTTDREGSQIFAKHKPWSTNRELDLTVRQWYGHYPTGLNVDELWILAIDSEHIVTFSSNQTWKSRWPPFQLTSRISDVSFRDIRNNFFRSGEDNEYNAITHAIASLSGAVGIMHRNFWPDLVLCLTDRYAGRLGHLQYRLHRSPSTKLVMELIACLEELNIVIQISEQQIETIQSLQADLDAVGLEKDTELPWTAGRMDHDVGYGGVDEYDTATRRRATRRSTYRQLSASLLTDPMAQLLDNLQRELADIRDLRDSTDRLVNRTIQLVNIRLEDHGKAILVFTIVTIIFLPLNFVSSFFGMNFRDIRDTQKTQWLFWAVAMCVTVGVVSASLFFAFSGTAILEKIHLWRDRKSEKPPRRTTRLPPVSQAGQHTFKVFGTDRGGWANSD